MVPQDQSGAPSPMDARTLEPAVKACLARIRAKLTEAQQIAKAAEACAQAGSLNEAVQISMGIEQLIYDAGRLHDAVSLLSRWAEPAS